MRFVATPHVPHNWESGLWFNATTRTLLVGDLFSALGDGPAIAPDLLEGAIVGEHAFHATSIGAATEPTIRALATV